MSSTSKNKSSNVGHSNDVSGSSSSSSSSSHHVHGHHHHHHHGNSSSSNNVETINLLVDNTTFVVNPEIFSSKKDTMLYRMFFSSPSIAKPNEKGQYVIEGFSATVFGAILVSKRLTIHCVCLLYIGTSTHTHTHWILNLINNPIYIVFTPSIYPFIHPSGKSNNHLTIWCIRGLEFK